jgi:hypothetical protein
MFSGRKKEKKSKYPTQKNTPWGDFLVFLAAI